MSYLVLARKYRPKRFADLVGQEHVARTLSNAFALSRIHHAFLFTGSRGVGKTSAARILAMALSCDQGPTSEPCGACESCKEIASGQSVDVVEIDGASNRGIDDARALREGVRYAPAKRRKKVYIIDEVHMLTTEAFNALLKTLEEPPGHVVFILATTEVHKIPATIMSRVQRYDFKLIPTTRLEQHLGGILTTEGVKFEPESVRLVARQAAGSVRDALSLLDQVIAYVGDELITAERVSAVLGLADRRLLVSLLGAVLDRQPGAALRVLAGALDRGVDLQHLAKSLLAFLHDVELAGIVDDPSDLVDASPDELAEAKALYARGPAGLFPTLFDRWARVVEEAGKSQTPRLLFEMALVDLTLIEPMLPLGDLLQRLEELEGRLAAGAPRPPAGPRPSGGGGGGGGGDSRSPAKPANDLQGGWGRPAERPPAGGGGSWPARASAAPAAALASAPVVSPAASSAPIDAADLWRRVQLKIHESRPALAAALDHAEVAEPNQPGVITLLFGERFTLDKVEKSKADLERGLEELAGRPVRLELKLGASGPGAAAAPARSTVGQELAAAEADRRRREDEARKHPIVQKAQDVFGVGVREVRTR